MRSAAEYCAIRYGERAEELPEWAMVELADKGRLEDRLREQHIRLYTLKREAKVVVEVLFGVAEVTRAPDWVEVEIIDYDNKEE